MDWTFAAVLVGVFLLFFAFALAAPAAHIALDIRDDRADGESLTVGRLVRDWLAAGLLQIFAAVPASGAAGLFWAAHRGAFRPYASVRAQARPQCEFDANSHGLRGALRPQAVDTCIAQAGAGAADD